MSTLVDATQPPGFAAFPETISSLAGQGASDSWVMTLTFALVGGCDIVTGRVLPSTTLEFDPFAALGFYDTGSFSRDDDMRTAARGAWC